MDNKNFWAVIEDRLNETPDMSIREIERRMDYSLGAIYKRLKRKPDTLPPAPVFRLLCHHLKLSEVEVLRDTGYLPKSALQDLTPNEDVLVS